MKADRGRPDSVGRSTGCSWLVACVVFSEVAEGSEGNGHKGGVTRGALSVMGTSTDVDNIRGNTGATLDDRKTGTRDETEDATLRGTDGVLIRCEGTAPT